MSDPSARLSVPNTYAQGRARPVARSVESGRCECGQAVREGYTRCWGCDAATYSRLSASNPNATKSWLHAAVSKTAECDCGRRRAVEAECCPTCRSIDGGERGLSALIVSTLKIRPEATVTELVAATGSSRRSDVYEALGGLLRARRVGRERVEYGSTLAWSYRLR